VPAGKLREVALMLKAIHAQEDLQAAQRKAAEIVARLHSMRLGKAAELVETAGRETLAYYAFPEEHWRRIRTNNPLERIMREIRRRTPRTRVLIFSVHDQIGDVLDALDARAYADERAKIASS
jgi:transposase-like protein